MAEVIGAAFLGVAKYVKNERGEDFLNKVIQDAGATTGEVFVKRIVTVGLYPYKAYIDFLKSLDRHLGRGDLSYCRKLGEIAARRDFEIIYSMYKKTGEAESLIRDCGLIWKSYYRNAGRMEAVAWAPDNTLMRIHDFPEMDSAHCRLIEGWMTGALRVIDVKMPEEFREIKCMSRGGPYHEFAARWSM